MYTSTSIANLALGHLGERHIDDINDPNSTTAEIIRDFYDHAKLTTFVAHDWNWAHREAQLQLLPTVPTISRWGYFYQLPPAFSRVSMASEDSEMRNLLYDKSGQWKILEGKFATNAEAVFMIYVANDWSESVWQPHFSEAMALKLAELSCGRITHNGQKAQNLGEKFTSRITAARVTDGQFQTSRQPFIRSEWARDRIGRGIRSIRPDIT